MIGIIFNSRKYYRQKAKKEPLNKAKGRENFGFYADLANEHQVDVCFYTVKNISKDGSRTEACVYSHTKKELKQRKNVRLPLVNICRHTSYNHKTIQKLTQAEKKYGLVFLNLMVSRKNKYVMERALRNFTSVKNYIPASAPLTFQNLIQAINRHGQVMIKPRIGNQGRNMMMLENKKGSFILHSVINKKPSQTIMNKPELKAYYDKKFTNPDKYFVQQYISILPYKGKNFDLRVNVQKNKTGAWQVSTYVCKIAQKDGIITNAAQGGTPRPGKVVDSVMSAQTKKNMYKLSVSMAKMIEKLNPRVIDLGLDIAIDRQNKPWFLEANFRSQKRPYIHFCGLKTWTAIQRPPFEYAVRLSKLKIKEKEHDDHSGSDSQAQSSR